MTGYLWGIYTRISDARRDKREGADRGVARQEKEVRERITEIDPAAVVVAVFTDNDKSAYSGKPRPAYDALLSAVREGRVNAICAWHTDRLHRSPAELEHYINITQDVPTYTVKAGMLDLSTASGRMTARILGAVARHESEHKAERILSKHRELAAAGRSTGGGFRPYGYVRVYDRPELPHRIIREDIVPEEAEIIRECARRILGGEGLYTVVNDLNARGIPTSAGARWSTRSLARMLASARIAGQREHRPRGRDEIKRALTGEVTATGKWAPIISVPQSEALRNKLNDTERRTSPGRTGRYLCAGGVLVCGQCGKKLSGRSRGAGKGAMYSCVGHQGGEPCCGRIHVDAPGADYVVTGWVSVRLARPAYREWLERRDDKPDESKLRAELDEVREKEKELAADWAEGRIGSAERFKSRDTLEARAARIQAQLSRASATLVLDGIPPGPADLQAWLLDGAVPVARRRAVVLAVLEKVTVSPAVKGRGRFDPERLDPRWKA
jgi:DNA invertase Pin-like site-specific DNA recombinase